MTDFTDMDLRAAVAAGHLSEAQAAQVMALAQARAGTRAGLPVEDEPFEFFRGFAEIFVAIGLAILFAGLSVGVTLFSGAAAIILLPAVWAAVAWGMAGYFTLKRRMNLPSMVLVIAFSAGIYLSALTALGNLDAGIRLSVIGAALVTVGALSAWYARFKLPFTMAVLASFALMAIYGATASLDSLGEMRGVSGVEGLFDLRQSPQFALSTLGFGAVVFAVAMWFDLRDPHRIGRHSATAFWLHLAAAMALVNTAAVTMMNLGGTTGMLATAGVMIVMTLLALLIDRRSFLTAGIFYVAAVIIWLVRDAAGLGVMSRTAVILVLLGGLFTALGTWWVPLRGALLRALPDFPGKNRLPPYVR